MIDHQIISYTRLSINISGVFERLVIIQCHRPLIQEHGFCLWLSWLIREFWSCKRKYCQRHGIPSSLWTVTDMNWTFTHMISILATLAAMVSHSKLFASAPKDIWLKINCVKYELYYWKNLNAEDLICLDFIKPLVGDYMRNCVLSVPKIKQVIQRLMLKLYESTCRIYPSISPFPYILFSKVRKHLLLTSRIVQPADTQGQHITLQYPKTLSYRGFFSVRRDNNCKTQSRTIAEKPTQSPPLTPGCWTLSRFFMSQVDVSCSIFVFPTSRTTLEKSTSERSWVDEGRVVWGLLAQPVFHNVFHSLSEPSHLQTIATHN